MKTLILVAGQSKRFWPLNEKPLFPICGKPLLTHVVDRLKEAGCDDLVFIGSKHNLEDVRALYPKATIVEQEKLELGMRGALLSSLPSLGDTPVLIVSANDVIDSTAYGQTVKAGKKYDGAILAQKVVRYFPGGYLSVKGEHVTGIVEKPGEGKEPSDLVTIVCHYHASAGILLNALKDVNEATDDGYEQALAKLFTEHTYAAVPYEGGWQAVKYPWHLLSVLPILLGNIKGQTLHKSATIHKSAVIEGDVVIGENVRILPNACIIGPCFIGKNSIVGNNALIRGSSVGEHCVVGYNTEVKGSILHSHVWTHSTYIGDSVVGENVSFGAGSVTGNLRLDEGEITSAHPSSSLGFARDYERASADDKIPTGLTKFGTIIGRDVRVGIRVGINPGIKIGQGSFISSGVMVEKDLNDGSFARMKGGEMIVSENKAKTPHPSGRETYKKSI